MKNRFAYLCILMEMLTLGLILSHCKKDEITSVDAPAEVQGTWVGYEVQGRS